MGVSKVSHEHFRAGIECIDDHFAIGRAGDFYPPIAQVRRDRRANPIAVADVFCFRKKIERSAAIELSLPILSASETLRPPVAKFAMEFCHERDRVRRQYFIKCWCDFAAQIDPCWQ